MAEKKYVVLDSFTTNGQETTRYKGRLIGLIDEKEFKAVVSSKIIQQRLTTSASMDLRDIADHFDDLRDLRLVISLREVDKKPVPKRLFITERLGYISGMNSKRTKISITGDRGGWMMLEEED